MFEGCVSPDATRGGPLPIQLSRLRQSQRSGQPQHQWYVQAFLWCRRTCSVPPPRVQVKASDPGFADGVDLFSGIFEHRFANLCTDSYLRPEPNRCSATDLPFPFLMSRGKMLLGSGSNPLAEKIAGQRYRDPLKNCYLPQGQGESNE